MLKEVTEGIDGVMTRMKSIDGRLDDLEERTRFRKLGMGTGVSLSGVNEGKEKFSLAEAIVGIGMKALGQDAWLKANTSRPSLLRPRRRRLIPAPEEPVADMWFQFRPCRTSLNGCMPISS
jgi:hypothetical protein